MEQTSVRDIISGPEVTFSFEVFPYKSAREVWQKNMDKLLLLNPSYVSITYGANGGNKETALDCLQYLLKEIVVVPHLTVINQTREETFDIYRKMMSMGARNIMVLRGDIIEKKGYLHPTDFIECLDKEDMCFGGGFYPELHPEESSMTESNAMLLYKSAYMDFFISQLFFNNDQYIDYCKNAKELGVTRPLVPGIMPVYSRSAIEKNKRFATLSEELLCLQNLQSDEEIYWKGLEIAAMQIKDLIERGQKHIHIYTMNNPQMVCDMFSLLGGVL